MNRHKIDERGSGVIEIILVVAVVALVVVFGWLAYKGHKKATPATTHVTTVAPAAKNVITITGLGVQFTVPDSLKNLSYHVVNTGIYSNPTAYLSTTTLNAAEGGKCDISAASSSAGTVPPLGFLVKTPGQYPASPNADNSTGILVKQFPAYYIAYRSAGTPCFSQQATNDTVASLNTQLSQALQSITEVK